MALPAFAALVLFTLTPTYAAPSKDAVPTLPSYGTPPSPMWSGYLDASASTPGTMLHYWFSAAEKDDWQDPRTPVVLWLNGGPGSSSILGMLQEMGPVVMNSTGGIMKNPYAWTKQANLLILEAPAGVGFSYCKEMLTGGNCKNTDLTTAADSRAAIQDFFSTHFPELNASSFYISGESYAGVYIPTLTKEILDNAPEVNIQGIAVGDPCTDTPSQSQSMDMLWYAHKHGLVPDADYAFLSTNCSQIYPAFISRGRWKRNEGAWAAHETAAVMELRGVEDAEKCLVAHRRFLMTTSKGLSQEWDGSYINELDIFTDSAALDWTLPGTENYFNARYMSREDVRKALHVEHAPAKVWPGPPEGWEYESSWNACNEAPGKDSMIQFYQNIAPRLSTTIVFNGDVDPCVSYEGTRSAIEKVGFAVKPGGEYRPWFYNKTAATVATLLAKPNLYGPNLELHNAGSQFGGQVVNYEHNLSFATVHGSGHMVPQFRPQAAERLLSQLLGGAEFKFSPPMPTDSELAKMTDSEFDSSVDSWTNAAKLLK